jgi:hypothetical protein
MSEEFKKIMKRYHEHRNIIDKLSKPKSVTGVLCDSDVGFQQLQFELDYAEQYTIKYDDIAGLRLQQRKNATGNNNNKSKEDKDKILKMRRGSFIHALEKEIHKDNVTIEETYNDTSTPRPVNEIAMAGSGSTSAVSDLQHRRSLSLVPLQEYLDEIGYVNDRSNYIFIIGKKNLSMFSKESSNSNIIHINEQKARNELISDKILKRLGKDISKNYKNEINNILSTKEGEKVLNKLVKRNKIQNTILLLENYEKKSENYKNKILSSLENYYDKSVNINKKLKYIFKNSMD